MMKIVHIAVQHSPSDSRIYHKECMSLADNADVHFMCRDTNATADSPVVFHPCAPYPDGDASPVRWLQRYFLCILTNFRKALRLRADVYHGHETPLIPLLVLLKLSGKTVVYDVHEDAPRQAISIGRSIGRPWLGQAYSLLCRLYETAARSLFDGFVAATPEIAERFPVKRTVVVRNFPVSSELEALGKGLENNPYTSRRRRIVYLGGLTRLRGSREILLAVERVARRSEVGLTLAGSFDSSRFEDECRGLAGWRCTEYRGVLDRQGVVKALSEARIGLVVVHPVDNYMESWPVKLFEYMAAGLPVIASDFPLWRERFERFACIRFVDPLDPAAIAAEIEHLLEHPREAASMGRRGRRAVSDHFSWQTERERLLRAYARLEAGG